MQTYLVSLPVIAAPTNPDEIFNRLVADEEDGQFRGLHALPEYVRSPDEHPALRDFWAATSLKRPWLKGSVTDAFTRLGTTGCPLTIWPTAHLEVHRTVRGVYNQSRRISTGCLMPRQPARVQLHTFRGPPV